MIKLFIQNIIRFKVFEAIKVHFDFVIYFFLKDFPSIVTRLMHQLNF